MKNAIALVAAATVGLVSATQAASIYTNDFNTDDSANWTINASKDTAGVATSDALFGYDYAASNIGIPLAPHTTDGSRLGLRVRADYTGTASDALGAISLSPKNQAFTTPYTISVDVWGNYVGGTSIAASGSNGSNGPIVGVGTAGGPTTPIASDAIFVANTHDGGTNNTDYRVYTKTTRQTAAQYYTATGANSQDNLNAYYAGLFPAHAAPSAQQTSFAATQTGNTPVGVTGFAWHTYALTNDGTTVTWYIDGKQIGTVPVSLAGTLGGSNISLGAFDINAASSTATNGALLNFELFDNLIVESGITVPEPTSLFAAGFAFSGLVARRRKA